MSRFSRIIHRGAAVARQVARDRPRAQTGSEKADVSYPTRQKPLFIGHTRFSVHQHGSGYFNATRGADEGAGFSEAEYTDWLYSEARLAPRTQIFTEMSLPQLARAAEEYDVVHYVSFSPSLPDRHKERLIAAAQEYDFLELNETSQPVNSTPSRTLVRRALDQRGITDEAFGVYRLDDDDLLSVNYFHQMAPYVTRKHIGWWVSLGTGTSAIRMDGQYAYAREMYYPKSAFGPMAIAAMDSDGAINNLQAPKHTVMDRTNPTILDSREPAYFHIRHESQDSTVKGDPAPFYPEAMRRIIGEGPADLEQTERLFPVLAGLMTRSPGLEGRNVELASGIALGREATTFDWTHDGPLTLLISLSDNAKLRSNQLQVRLTVESEGSTDGAGRQEYLRQGHFKWSDRDQTYWSYVPQKSSGFGHVLPVEPPPGSQVTSITLVTSSSETLDVEKIVAFPLPHRAA